MMKIREAESRITRGISGIYQEDEARNIARLLLEHLTGLPPGEIAAGREHEPESLNDDLLDQFILRLKAHEPVQYIMNKCWFHGLELYVDPHVLIPRPETEELVEWVLNDVRQSGADVFKKLPTAADKTRSLKILDICTGSGCIALSLKQAMPLAEVWGCDVSEAALNVARRNGAELDIRVDFQGMNFLDRAQQKLLPSADIVVSNPPYIPESERREMNRNVTDHEPSLALFVPDEDPLVFYRALIDFASHRLHPGGSLYMELHEGLYQPALQLFEENGFRTTLKKDMQGKHRMLKAQLIS